MDRAADKDTDPSIYGDVCRCELLGNFLPPPPPHPHPIKISWTPYLRSVSLPLLMFVYLLF